MSCPRCAVVLLALIVPLISGLTEYACENQDFSVSCLGRDEVMVINSAMYGIPSGKSVAGCTRSSSAQPCSARQAKALVDERCAGREGCEFELVHSKFPVKECPPDPGNELVVYYDCVLSSKILDICKIDPENLPLEGYLSSPYYPENYPTVKECSVTLPAQAGDDLIFQVKDLFIETRRATDCLDYLLIKDTGNPSQDMKFCETIFNTSHPSTVISVIRGTVEIHFKSDSVYDMTSRGFLLHYIVTHNGPRIKATSSTPSTTLTTPHLTSVIWKRPPTIAASTIVVPTTPSTTPSPPAIQTATPTTPKPVSTSKSATEGNLEQIPTGTTIKSGTTLLRTSASVPAYTSKVILSSVNANPTTTLSSTVRHIVPKTTTTTTTPERRTTITTTTELTTTPNSTIVVAPVTKSHKGLTTNEKVAVIVVILGVFFIAFIIIIICWCRWRHDKSSKFLMVRYTRDSSLLSVPSNESSGSTLSAASTITVKEYPDISFENPMVYTVDYDNPGSKAVMVGDSGIQPCPALTYEIGNDLESPKEAESDNAINEDLALPVKAESLVDAGTDPDDLEGSQEDVAKDGLENIPMDIFIMDKEAMERQKRREDAKRDEPPEDLMSDTDLALEHEESMRLNIVPEISLGQDQIISFGSDVHNDKSDAESEGHYEEVGQDPDSSMEQSEIIETVVDVEKIPEDQECEASGSEESKKQSDTESLVDDPDKDFFNDNNNAQKYYDDDEIVSLDDHETKISKL